MPLPAPASVPPGPTQSRRHRPRSSRRNKRRLATAAARCSRGSRETFTPRPQADQRQVRDRAGSAHVPIAPGGGLPTQDRHRDWFRPRWPGADPHNPYHDRRRPSAPRASRGATVRIVRVAIEGQFHQPLRGYISADGRKDADGRGKDAVPTARANPLKSMLYGKHEFIAANRATMQALARVNSSGA